MISLDDILNLIDRFDVPTLAVLSWFWIRSIKASNAAAMAKQQTAFVEALSAIKTEMGTFTGNLVAQTQALETQTNAFLRHVDQDRDDHKSLVEKIDTRCAEIFGKIDTLTTEVHDLQLKGAANA